MLWRQSTRTVHLRKHLRPRIVSPVCQKNKQKVEINPENRELMLWRQSTRTVYLRTHLRPRIVSPLEVKTT